MHHHYHHHRHHHDIYHRQQPGRYCLQTFLLRLLIKESQEEGDHSLEKANVHGFRTPSYQAWSLQLAIQVQSFNVRGVGSTILAH